MSPSTHQALHDARNKSVVIYVDGEWLARPDAKITVFDSAFLVGDGVWEGIRYHNGAFVHLDRHLDRLMASARGVHLDIGTSRQGLVALLDETIARNHMKTGVHVRLMITRGTKKTPSQDPRLVVGGPSIVIIAEYKESDPDVTSAGISLFTAAVRRPAPDTLDQRWNSHSKLHEVVALYQAMDSGADEALMLDANGNVATCNATNFFMATGGELWTSSGEYCLNGITRGLVIELARAVGVTVLEKDFSVSDVYVADEAFVTGTFGGLTPVVSVDDHTIGTGAIGPLTERLGHIYREAVYGEDA